MDAVVFDCDGVLVDSERLLVTIDQQVYAELGWNASIEEIAERFVGKGQKQHEAEVRAVLGDIGPDWREAYDHLYERAMREDLTGIDGIESALQAISLPKAVASNSSTDTLRQSLVTTSLIDYFGGRIVSADDVEYPKPAPDVYLRAAELLDVPATRCFAVEDSRPGVAAAKAAGMYVFGYGGGGLTPPKVLRDAGAHVFMTMEELPGLISALTEADAAAL